MVSFLDLGSLILGLVAWILPVINLSRSEKHDNKKWFTFSIMSLSACSISLCFQILYINYIVNIEDWSALLDTMGAVVLASTVLLIVTIILNLITLMVYSKRAAK